MCAHAPIMGRQLLQKTAVAEAAGHPLDLDLLCILQPLAEVLIALLVIVSDLISV
jgi:hypothetical protein